MKPVLFHWSPAARREQIRRYGLMPGQEPTTVQCGGVEYLCLAADPARAWNLSAAMPWTPDGEWDLWQARLNNEYGMRLRVEDGEVLEFKVYDLIPPERLWLVGTRESTPVVAIESEKS